MTSSNTLSLSTLPRDLTSGLVVYLVALPLCLGIALASNAPLFAGLISGIVGGVIVGALSGSHTSVSGPAAGLTAVIIAQIEALGSFQALLLAIAIGGVLQIGLGLAKAGSLARFFPTSVIKGLLAAIGIILILKQIPHVFGHDSDPEGDMSFVQPDQQNTFSEIASILGDLHTGATVIGIVSILLLVFWDKIPPRRSSSSCSALEPPYSFGLGAAAGRSAQATWFRCPLLRTSRDFSASSSFRTFLSG